MQENELPELKQVYENLWDDARTLIKDLSRSITIVGLFGALLISASIFQLSIADSNYSKIASGSARLVDYIYFGGGIVGTIIYIAGGVAMLRWYIILRRRYSRVTELEKKIEKR